MLSPPRTHRLQLGFTKYANAITLSGRTFRPLWLLKKNGNLSNGITAFNFPINSLVRSERGGSRCHGSLRLDESIWSYKTEMAPDSDEKEKQKGREKNSSILVGGD